MEKVGLDEGHVYANQNFRSKACPDTINSLYFFEASAISSDGKFLFFFPKKLKHKKTVKKLQTDLAIAKQEAAITVLELKEKIKTLCEGRPCPRGQYHYPVQAHFGSSFWVMHCMQIEWQQKQMLGPVPGSVLAEMLVWPS